MPFTELIRIGRFGTVGVLNTLIDFTIFNLLTSRRIRWSYIRANLVSSTVAMTFSFLANKRAVFRAGGNTLVQAAAFFAVTAFGLWVIQNVVMHLLTKRWQWPKKLAAWTSRIGFGRVTSQAFILKNGAKVASVLVTLIWNYLLYRNLVFKL